MSSKPATCRWDRISQKNGEPPGTWCSREVVNGHHLCKEHLTRLQELALSQARPTDKKVLDKYGKPVAQILLGAVASKGVEAIIAYWPQIVAAISSLTGEVPPVGAEGQLQVSFSWEQQEVVFLSLNDPPETHDKEIPIHVPRRHWPADFSAGLNSEDGWIVIDHFIRKHVLTA